MAATLRALYICYLSLEDPLAHTQVVAYLEGLASRGHTIHLLTFDGELDAERRRDFAAELSQRGIVWHSARYHKRPSLPATIYDVFAGAALAVRLVRRHGLDAIHARNHVPAAMALMACRLTRARLIFDVRGLMADEYADAGRWRKGGVPYRLTERIQRVALRRADGLVMLTEAVRPYLLDGGSGSNSAAVIPCCADLEQIERGLADRQAARAELALGERPVMVYVGKFTGWYMEREMADFFAAARERIPELFFLIVTQADPGPMLAELNRQGIGEHDYRVTRAAPEEMGRVLSACDFGISLIRPCFSKISSSPTKIGEYLGAGLPVVSTSGIGDVDELLDGNGVGALIRDFTERGYESATSAIEQLLGDDATRARCRSVARERLSLRDVGIPRYDELYRRIALG